MIRVGVFLSAFTLVMICSGNIFAAEFHYGVCRRTQRFCPTATPKTGSRICSFETGLSRSAGRAWSGGGWNRKCGTDHFAGSLSTPFNFSNSSRRRINSAIRFPAAARIHIRRVSTNSNMEPSSRKFFRHSPRLISMRFARRSKRF